MKMFGCEYRDGRAAAAPLLRPKDAEQRADATQQINNVDRATLLPHLQNPEIIDRLYPRMEAPPEYGDVDFE